MVGFGLTCKVREKSRDVDENDGFAKWKRLLHGFMAVARPCLVVFSAVLCAVRVCYTV